MVTLSEPLFCTVEDSQYGGRCLVLWGDIISTVDGVQYSGGIPSVQWKIFGTVEGYHLISTVEGYHQWRVFSTFGRAISTMEVI